MNVPITIPFVGSAEAAAAAAVIESGWLTQGPKVAEFERLFANYCQTKHAVAVSSCTTALHLSLEVLGIGSGDEVICPSMSFIATANSIKHSGATPVFADVNPETFNLDPDAVEALINERTRAILVVHQIGIPAEIDRFIALGEKYNIKIVEDAACAIGSRYKGKPIGGHTEMASFSFHPRKVITTGDGGMITTDNDEYAKTLRLMRQHGMSLSDAARHGSDKVVFEQYVMPAWNYRLTDIQAAVGIEQMKRLDEIVEKRISLAATYDAALRKHPWLTSYAVPVDSVWNYQSYPVQIEPHAPMLRTEVMQSLLENGVSTRRGIMLSHLEPAYRDHGNKGPLDQSELASNNSMLLPLYPTMTETDQQQVISSLMTLPRGVAL